MSRPTGTDQKPPAVPTAPGPRPIIQADNPAIDLGTVWKRDAVVTGSFTIRNSGEALLEIKAVGCSWECGSAGEKGVKLDPGESWELPVAMNLQDQQGLKLHRVVVLSNDPERPELELKVFGTIREPLTLDPGNGTFFGNVGRDETRERVLLLKNNTPEPMHPKLVRAEGRNFSIRLETVTAGKEYRLVLTARPPYNPGANTGLLELATGLEVQPTLILRPQATLPPRLLYPEVVTVPQPLTPGTSRVVSIRNNGDQPVKVLGASTPLEGATAEITSVKEGKVHNVTIRFTGSLTLPPEGSELVIRTDDPEFPALKVRLLGETVPGEMETPAP